MKRCFSLIIIALALTVSASASAKVSKELRAELDGYLEKLAAEPDSESQQAVLLTRATLDKKKAKKDLETAQTNDDKSIRLAATMGLVMAGDKKAIGALAKELGADAKLFDTLRERISVLDDKTETKVLSALLKDGKPEARTAVARYLASQKGDLFKYFESFITGKDDAMRLEALTAATARADARALSAAGKIKKGDEKSRMAALALAEAVSMRESTRVEGLKALAPFASDASAKIRERAAKTLVKLNDKAGAPALFAMLKDKKESSARQDIMRFLLEHNVKARMADVEPYLAATDAEERALAHQLAATAGSADFTKKLIEMERSTEFVDRIVGIRALGWTGSDSAATILARTLFEGRKDVRLASVAGLRKLGKAKTFGALEKSLRGEKDPEIKLAVIDAMGSFKSKNALRALRFLVTNNDRRVRLQVAKSVRRIGMEEGAGALEVLLRDRDREIQWAAFMTALEIKPSLGMSRLEKMMRNPAADYINDMAKLKGKTRTQVFDYLLTKASDSAQSDAIRWSMKQGGADKTLQKLLLDDKTSSGDQRALMYYFADAKDPAGMAGIEKLIRKSKVKQLRRACAWLLVRDVNKSMDPTFRGLLADGDAAIRAIAIYGIARINA